MVNDSDPIKRYRNRAEELRAIAESLTDPENRKVLEDWAKDYDRKVQQAEAKADE